MVNNQQVDYIQLFINIKKNVFKIRIHIIIILS